MSEFQYYEFQAVDRPLTKKEMAALRAILSRAEITSTRLVNTYAWDDFKGDPVKLMETYFDAFVYAANWGTREFMLRLPRHDLGLKEARLYCGRESLWMKTRGDQIILGFQADDEGGEWEGWMDSEKWMPVLLPLRRNLAAGDLRCLHPGWLRCVQNGELKETEREPPVPHRRSAPS